MFKSNLRDYSDDAFILVKETITITERPENATDINKLFGERNKGVIFKNCAPFTFTDCMSKVNNNQVDSATI